MNYRHISEDTIGGIISRLAAGVVISEKYAKANKGGVQDDMQGLSLFMVESMHLLIGKDKAEGFLAHLRESLAAETINQDVAP